MICLSGGGFRAALFHTGVLRAIYEREEPRYADPVVFPYTLLACVSGGALPAAVWSLHRPKSFHVDYGPERIIRRVVSSSPFSKFLGRLPVPGASDYLERLQLSLGRLWSLGGLLPIVGRKGIWDITHQVLKRHVARYLEEHGHRPLRLGDLSHAYQSGATPVFETINLSEGEITYWSPNYIGSSNYRLFSIYSNEGGIRPSAVDLAEIVAICMAHPLTSGPIRGEWRVVPEFHADAGMLDNLAMAILANSTAATTHTGTIAPIRDVIVSYAGAPSTYHRGHVDSRLAAMRLMLVPSDLTNFWGYSLITTMMRNPAGLIHQDANLRTVSIAESPLWSLPTGLQRISPANQAELLFAGYRHASEALYPDIPSVIESASDYESLTAPTA